MKQEMTYEDLMNLGNGPGRGRWQMIIRDMQPGDVKHVEISEKDRRSAGFGVRQAAKNAGRAGEFTTRLHGDVLYVICVKLEDRQA